MYEVTYYSIAKRNITKQDINEILVSSRSFNQKNDITGCLLYYRDQFIQVLEGDKIKIMELLEKITRDNRHADVFILSEGEKDERTFSNWTMAYQELQDDDVKKIGEALFINNFLTFSSLISKPTHTIRLFWSRAQRMLTANYN